MTDIAVTHIDDDGVADVVRCDAEYYVVELNSAGQWCVRCYSSAIPDDVLCIDVRNGNRFVNVEACCYSSKQQCSDDLFRYLEDMTQAKLTSE